MELRMLDDERPRLPMDCQMPTSPTSDQAREMFDFERRKHHRRGRRRRPASDDLNDDQITLTNSSLVAMQPTYARVALVSEATGTTTTTATRQIKSHNIVYFKPRATSQQPRYRFRTKTKLAQTRSSRQQRREARNVLYTLFTITALVYLHAETRTTPTLTQAFNIDTQSAVVHSGPEDSYFGYSVAQHRDRGVNWLLVGAPKAQTDQPKTRKTGAVYRCAPSNANACQQIAFDPNGSSEIKLGNEKVQADDKSHQWFGASLQSATENGSIVACAPRYVYYSTNLKRRDPVGTCWVSRGSFSGFLDYSPCRLNDQWGHHHLGSCQAGFSSAISKDGSRLFMGAPGSHVWQGQVFAHNLKTDLKNSTSSVNPHSEDDSYLGYSLALGRFSSQPASAFSSDHSDVAIGIPRGNELAGKVMLVDREMRFLRNITGEQVGSYFGYSLATVDFNGDNLDDLLISAPLYYNQTTSHKEPHFDRGRVYVVQQTSRGELSIVQRLDGHKNRARFGTALANCGDLNRDGFQDVAIGAPYDGPEQRGAVYIYLGRKSGGLSDQFDQVIFAESIRMPTVSQGEIRAFGFSLSAGIDLDGNQYADILAGAYESNHAILLRTRPVVQVTSSLTFQPEHFNLDDKTCLLPNSTTSVPCITVQYCTKYTGLNVDNRLSFVYDIKLDTENNKGAPRLFFLHNEGKNEDRNTSVLTKDVNQCRSFKAYISRQIRDKLTPLKVDVDYNLADYAGETYDFAAAQPKLKPVLNRLTSNKLSKSATIQKNCGPDNVCVPDLKLTVNPNIDQYTIGSNEKLILDVTVKNYAEDAFESMFYLTMPQTINFITINKTRADYPVCYGAKPDETGQNVLTCDLGNPMVRNDVVKFSVITEPARGVFTSPDFTFVAQVNSTNPEQDDRHREDNQVAIGIPIRVEVQLVLSGNSQPQLVVHNSTRHQRSGILGSLGGGSGDTAAAPLTATVKQSEADVGQEVYHIYQLQNRGPSTINDIAITILWPTRRADGQYLLYLVDEPFTSDKVKCKPAPEDAINPMSLKYLRGNSVNLPSTGVVVATPTTATTTTTNNNHPNGYYVSSGNRFKRQTASDPVALAQAQPQVATTTTVDHSIAQDPNICGQTQCTRFECNVFDLGHNEIATIRIRSRLYEDTVNALSLQEFVISSVLFAQVKALPYNVSSHSMPPYKYQVETQVHTTGIGVQDLLPWWLILLAILLGIALFVLLACFLRYLGFFARKRPPQSAAAGGGGRGGAEREPLTPTMWNDYHYTPGDTAL